MQKVRKIKIGPFLVIASVLAVWTLLAVGSVQAHNITDPNCYSLPKATFFEDDQGTAVSTATRASATGLATKKGTGKTDEGSKSYYYARITVPAMTAGELTVSDSQDTIASEAILCGRQEGSVSSRPSYPSAHTTADSAAATAAKAATAAGQTGASLSTARTAARTAGSALTTIAKALRDAGKTTEADTADAAAATAKAAGDSSSTNTNTLDDLDGDDGALQTAANALTAAANALASHTGFDINALISSGDEEYVVVVSIPSTETTTVPEVNVSFEGVMAPEDDTLNGQDEGSFTKDNDLITHTLATTANTPGLLTVRTTGSAVDTKGTLVQGSTTIATDEGTGGNFEIVSPVRAGTAYSIQVTGQTRYERGDYGLKMEFGVAVNLATDAAYADTTRTSDVLEPGRADYFYFNGPTQRLLTVETRKHTSLTKETDTTGALYGRNGQITTDTNSGAGSNFLLRAPISAAHDYIVEVKGASSSTKGAYILAATSSTADDRGTAPDTLDATPDTDTTLAAAGVNVYSISVTTPGTLQVKTTGSTDTVGVLYGPDGHTIATDDNSGKDTNFSITQYVKAGQHIVTVEGQGRDTTGTYRLVVNFVEGATVGGPTDPGSGDEVTRLRAEVARLQNELNECRVPVVTHARGNLGNPSGGYRSGIGLISGWVCAAEEVTVDILRGGVVQETLTVAHGTTRTDTVGQCRHNSANTGFGATYNFNHLAEGTYTIRAYADDTQIGEERTFEVVHIAEFADSDTDRFLRLEDEVQDRGVCIVPDFPVTGKRTWLKWEESIQNFVIEDQG